MSSINKIESEIEKLDNIQDWNEKIDSIKKIKNDIKEEEEVINKLLNDLESDTRKIKKKKMDINEIMNCINNETDTTTRINCYHMLNNYIKQLNNELFE